jgi:hypothetical protein
MVLLALKRKASSLVCWLAWVVVATAGLPSPVRGSTAGKVFEGHDVVNFGAGNAGTYSSKTLNSLLNRIHSPNGMKRTSSSTPICVFLLL